MRELLYRTVTCTVGTGAERMQTLPKPSQAQSHHPLRKKSQPTKRTLQNISLQRVSDLLSVMSARKIAYVCIGETTLPKAGGRLEQACHRADSLGYSLVAVAANVFSLLATNICKQLSNALTARDMHPAADHAK